MKKILVCTLLLFFIFNTIIIAQVENLSVDGKWRSVRMELVKDEFYPFFMYYPESDEDALKMEICKGDVYFDKDVYTLKSETWYSYVFDDEMKSSKLAIVKSDNYHIVVRIPPGYSFGFNSPPPAYVAFERDY